MKHRAALIALLLFALAPAAHAQDDAWKGFYQEKAAPFSWQPENVEVLDSGDFGFSSGPVFDPAGKRVGTFNSVWRKEKDGKWRIIFDNGCPRCDCGQAKATP